MEFLKNNWIGLVAIVIAIAAYTASVQSADQGFGGVQNYDNIQLTSTGTSTLTRVGCYQGYATSTATSTLTLLLKRNFP